MAEQAGKLPLLIQYDLHHRLYNNVLDGFSNEETEQRLNGFQDISHAKYLAGHMLNSQYGLAMIAGLKPDVRWNDMFAVMGQSAAKDNVTYPHIDDIKSEWNGMHGNIRAGLEKLTDVELQGKPPTPFDRVSESVLQLWAFINHHQAYHIGQIGILRRGFGKSPMSYE